MSLVSGVDTGHDRMINRRSAYVRGDTRRSSHGTKLREVNMKNVLCALALAGLSGSVVAGEVFNQGFETDTAGWSDGGSYGSITRVTSGDNGITSASGGHHAVVTSSTQSASYTFFGGSSSTFGGGYTASSDMYLDTSWSDGEGFEFSVASYNQAGNHLQDFIFHVTADDSNNILVSANNNGSNNSAGTGLPTTDTTGNFGTISMSGWYTFEHVFRDNGDGTLAVDLNVFPKGSNTAVFTETLNSASNDLATTVGGNGYGWFNVLNIGDGLALDNVTLTVVPLPPAALAGLGMLAGFAGVRKLRQR